MKKFVPLRNYIFDRLYHPTQGYFCKPSILPSTQTSKSDNSNPLSTSKNS